MAKVWRNTGTGETMTPTLLDGRDPQGEICRCFTQIQRIFALT